MAIEPVGISTSGENSISARWGITANEYRYDNSQTDLQDLMVAVSKKRAVTVEGEVQPLSQRIRNRNERLDALGRILAALTELQTSYPEDDDNDDTKDIKGLSEADMRMLWDITNANPQDAAFFRSECEGAVQLVKSEIDGLNNRAQLDMTRLQQLVDRRDESFSTATSLMTEISETRDNTIRNM